MEKEEVQTTPAVAEVVGTAMEEEADTRPGPTEESGQEVEVQVHHIEADMEATVASS